MAAHLEPEILVIDEVLATGDAAFQRKSLGKMRDVAESGRTVLFVSHNISAVRSLCTRAIFLRDGGIVEDGPVEEVVQTYLRALRDDEAGERRATGNTKRSTRGTVRLTDVRACDAAGTLTQQLVAGEPVTFEVDFESSDPEGRLNVNLTVRNDDDVPILLLTPRSGGTSLTPAARGMLTCRLPRLPLSLGDYRVEAVAFDTAGKSDILRHALSFTVSSAVLPLGATPPISQKAAVIVDQEWSQSKSRPSAPERTSDREPAVSVLLPIRNGETYIEDAVETLRAQTFADFELIVVDDASEDATPVSYTHLRAHET